MHVKCNWEIHLNYDASLPSYVENTTLQVCPPTYHHKQLKEICSVTYYTTPIK